MFPDVKGLTATIEKNTETQEVMIELMQEMNRTLVTLTGQIRELNMRGVLPRNTRTNSSGPK